MIVALLVSGVLSCSNLQPADVVGTWVVTDASRTRLPADAQKAAARIVLDANGTFVATDVPGLFARDERDASILETGRGVWRFVTLGGEQQLLLEFRQRSNTPDQSSRGLHVSRRRLYYFIGGPDVGLRVSLEKQ